MNFQERIHQDLYEYLRMEQLVDEMLPTCPDVEGKWTEICEEYLPDGVREFANYPTASLGWMMYIGMAIAKFWDENWTDYNDIDNLYESIRDERGYDHLDEYVLEEVLSLSKDERKDIENIVGECAARTLSNLRREKIQPSTPEAFNAYVNCLHELYLMGCYVQLKAMGYHLVKSE